MRKKTLIGIFSVVLLLLLSPLLARIGSWKEIRRWDAPETNTLGHDRLIYLSVERMYSYFDPFELYGMHRLVVSDGGYSYVYYFEAPEYPSENWVNHCEANWTPEGVTLKNPKGLSIAISAEAILQKL